MNYHFYETVQNAQRLKKTGKFLVYL